MRETRFGGSVISRGMVEKTDRTAGSNGPRSADGRRFEVFVREEEADPLRHVGTVAAPTPDAAHEEASKLFAWYARDVWVCPADKTRRYSAESMAENTDASGNAPDQSTDAVNGTPEGSGDADEPRVYEETEGTPTVSSGGAPADDDSESSDAVNGVDDRDAPAEDLQ